MRIDNIDLIGEFKIQGLTGSSSQALGLSGGSLNWIEVSGGGGSNAGLVKNSGYNYILVQATGDAISNGNKLIQAYTDASTLVNANYIGSPSVSNRFTILLTPGIYDLDTQYVDLTTPFIDIIGLSTNPLDTKIKAYGSQYIFYIQASVDTALENVWLDSNTELFIYDGGSGGSIFLRWKNLVLRGNGFYSGLGYALYDIDGYFENIKYTSPDPSPGTEYFVIVGRTLNGTYKNIDLGLVTNAFYSEGGQINAKFSNITNTNSTGIIFFTDGNSISGRIENVRLNMTGGGVFTIGNAGVVGKLNGTFKNIHITGQVVSSFYGPVANNSYFESITIDDATYVTGSVCFGFYGDDSYGTYKDIKIGNVYGDVFYSGSQSLFATFSNIEIGNCDSCFYAGTNLHGTYEKIKIGNTSVFAFSTAGFQGIFKNISGVNFGNLFYGNASSGTFENITFGDSNSGQSFYMTGGVLDGNFKNIRLGSGFQDAFFSGAEIIGNFENIHISQVTGTLFNSTTANFVMNDLKIGSANNFLVCSIIYGTFSNIKIDNLTGNEITSSSDINIRLENYSSNSTNNEVLTTLGSIYGYYKNIELNGTRSKIFDGLYVLPTLVENLKCDGSSTFFYTIGGGGDIDGTFRNISVGNITTDGFKSFNGNIYGTYSNINIGSADGVEVFRATSNIEVNVDGLFIGTCSTAFVANAKSQNTKINNLEMFGNFSGYNAGGSKFSGIISNSTIDMRGFGDYIWYQNGIIERSKILTNVGGNSLIANNAFFTSLNEPPTWAGVTYGLIVDSGV